MESRGRRVAGGARGPAETGARGAGAASSGLPAAPARFRCPEDFCARRFAPGAALCPESLAGPGKRLLLIRAPADFRPESLSGRRLALPGSPLCRASQPDGSQKVYGLRATREESAARLLIATAWPERLTCAQPFGGCLRIRESDGEPGDPRPLFPVAERPPPRVPEGLKQRFFPFGARLRRPREATWEAREGWRHLPGEGPEWPPGGSMEPASKRRPLKEVAATGPAGLPGPGGRLPWHDARPGGQLEAASLSGEPGGRRARKREKKRKASLETEEGTEPSARCWQPDREARLQGGSEPQGAGAKKRKRRTAEAEGLPGAAAIKEEPGGLPGLGSLREENPRAIGEDLAGDMPSCKKRRKKRSRERAAEGQWGAFAIKEEPSLPEEGLGSPREGPGGELACSIKQSPGRAEGGLWGVAALKEEPGDVPCRGSLPEEGLGVTPEDAGGELPGCKKKRRSRERVAEGPWGVAAIKEEPGDSCWGSLPEESRGSARGGAAGACKKKKKKGGKPDKEPPQEQGTETEGLESKVPDWAAPLWQEAGPEEPWQTNGAAPSPRPKKKKGRRREREGQAALFARGTE